MLPLLKRTEKGSVMYGQLRILDLFSGIGGFSLGLERAGRRTEAFCEIEPYCRRVLEKHWPNVPIHSDIRQLDGTQFAGSIDVVCGGYPCQPFSVAGKQRAEADPRHLWPEMHRIIRESRPRWVIAENVRGHVSLGFDTVATQLEDDGFTVWPFIVPACAVGAPHRRDRLWIVAHSARNGRSEVRSWKSAASGEDVANPKGERPGETRELRRHKSEEWLTSRSKALADCQQPGLEGHARHGDKGNQSGRLDPESNRSISPSSLCTTMANPEGSRSPAPRPGVCKSQWPDRDSRGSESKADSSRQSHWFAEPDVGRVAHGVPSRVDRLKALGNAVVPQIPQLIGRAILAYEQHLAMAA